MADEKISLEVLIEAPKAAQTLGELEDSLEDLNKAIREVPRGSKEFDKLSTAIATAGREVKNMELNMEALDNEQVAGEIGSVAGAFGDVTASMILLGGENESLEEMAQNIEVAMGVSMGLKGAIEGVSSGMKLYNNLMKTGQIQTALLAAKTTIASTAQKILNAVMSANPIALLVVGMTTLVGLLIAYGDEAAVASREQEIFNDAQKDAADSTAKERAELTKLLAIAEDNTQSLEDRNKAITALNELSPEYLGNLTLDKLGTEEATAAIDKYVESLQAKAMAQALEEQLVEATKVLLEAQLQTQEELIEQTSIFAIATTGLNGAQETLNNTKQESIDKAQAEIDAILNVMKAQEQQGDLIEVNAEKEVEAVRKVTKAKKLSAKELQELADQKEFEDAVREQGRIERIESVGMQEIEVEKNLMQLRQDNRESFEEWEKRTHQEKLDRLAEEDAARQSQIDKAQAGLDVLSSAADLFVKDEVKRDKIKKKLAVAQLAIDTARAISSGIASASAVPFPGNIVAILSTVATVLANVAQAKKLLSSAGASGGGSSSLGAAASGASGGSGGANINPVSNTSTILGDQNVVVAEGDITAVQSKVQVTEALATF